MIIARLLIITFAVTTAISTVKSQDLIEGYVVTFSRDTIPANFKIKGFDKIIAFEGGPNERRKLSESISGTFSDGKPFTYQPNDIPEFFAGGYRFFSITGFNTPIFVHKDSAIDTEILVFARETQSGFYSHLCYTALVAMGPNGQYALFEINLLANKLGDMMTEYSSFVRPSARSECMKEWLKDDRIVLGIMKGRRALNAREWSELVRRYNYHKKNNQLLPDEKGIQPLPYKGDDMEPSVNDTSIYDVVYSRLISKLYDDELIIQRRFSRLGTLAMRGKIIYNCVKTIEINLKLLHIQYSNKKLSSTTAELINQVKTCLERLNKGETGMDLSYYEKELDFYERQLNN